MEALGKFVLIQDITFSNDSGTVAVFTVTGDVLLRIIPVVTTDITSAANGTISLGTTTDATAMLNPTLSTDLDARMIWNDQTPGSEVEATETLRDYIVTDGNDIQMTLSAQIDAGVIRFYGFWTPLSSDGKVVSA